LVSLYETESRKTAGGAVNSGYCCNRIMIKQVAKDTWAWGYKHKDNYKAGIEFKF
jgi:hypothetical protein